MDDGYVIGWVIHAIVFFIAIWIYATVNYRFLLGFCLGWIPAAFGAAILAIAWPLYWLAIAGAVFLYLINN